MLSITVERAGSTAMVHCAGRIVIGERLSALRDAVVCEFGKPTTILELSRVDRIDAGGLGLLVFLHTIANGLGTELRLLSPSPHVAEMLGLTKLDSVLSVYATRDTAEEHAPLPAYSECEACA